MRRCNALTSLRIAFPSCAVVFVVACGGSNAAPSSGSVASSVASSVTTSAAAIRSGGSIVKTFRADADPCGWIDAADVARLLGPLAQAPRRGQSASNAEPAESGRACVYALKRVEPGAEGSEEVAVELVIEDAMTNETSTEAGKALGSRVLARAVGGSAEGDASAAKPGAGWDYTGWTPNEFIGRVGHVAVDVRMHTHGAPLTTIATDSVERLAALVRDRVPDVPAAAPRDTWNNGDGGDPCSLITRAEAEAVLGKLTVAPYRSNRESPLVDPSGDGCSYYLGRHRVFTIKPEWTQGKTLFGVAAGASQAFSSVAGLTRSAADTLDGAWDQAAMGLDGTLYFLAGDRMLAVAYRTAAVDVTTALRLATVAVKRLR